MYNVEMKENCIWHFRSRLRAVPFITRRNYAQLNRTSLLLNLVTESAVAFENCPPSLWAAFLFLNNRELTTPLAKSVEVAEATDNDQTTYFAVYQCRWVVFVCQLSQRVATHLRQRIYGSGVNIKKMNDSKDAVNCTLLVLNVALDFVLILSSPVGSTAQRGTGHQNAGLGM